LQKQEKAKKWSVNSIVIGVGLLTR
jgi:hypothetical protein